MNGVINVLKPPGMTSHDVIYFIRRKLKIKKAGHTGTLDPEAAGVLPVCLGKATKAVQYITDKRKRYRTTVKFGIKTETYDKYGKIIEQNPVNTIDIDKLELILCDFKGKIRQLPPIYSAIKLEGKKLYQYALAGEEVEIKEREVEIFSIEIVDYDGKDQVVLDIECSKGTYIRSICHDIGEKMGCGACMWQLIRTASTPFDISEAYTLEEIDRAVLDGSIDKLVTNTDIIFKELPKVTLKKTAGNAALSGSPIYPKGIIDDLDSIEADTNTAVFIENEFIGIGTIKYSSEENRKYLKIDKIFI